MIICHRGPQEGILINDSILKIVRPKKITIFVERLWCIK